MYLPFARVPIYLHMRHEHMTGEGCMTLLWRCGLLDLQLAFCFGAADEHACAREYVEDVHAAYVHL